MPGPTSLLWCSLTPAATTILSPFSSNAQGQLPDAKPRPTGSITSFRSDANKVRKSSVYGPAFAAASELIRESLDAL